jgi:hypothetical protein
MSSHVLRRHQVPNAAPSDEEAGAHRLETLVKVPLGVAQEYDASANRTV